MEALLRWDDAPFQGLRSTGSMCSSLRASSTDSNLQLTAKIGFITLRLLFSLTRVSAVCPVLLALFSEPRPSCSCSTTLTEELGCSAQPQLLFTIVPLLLRFWGMGHKIYPEAEEPRSQTHKPKPEDCQAVSQQTNSRSLGTSPFSRCVCAAPSTVAPSALQAASAPSPRQQGGSK